MKTALLVSVMAALLALASVAGREFLIDRNIVWLTLTAGALAVAAFVLLAYGVVT